MSGTVLFGRADSQRTPSFAWCRSQGPRLASARRPRGTGLDSVCERWEFELAESSVEETAPGVAGAADTAPIGAGPAAGGSPPGAGAARRRALAPRSWSRRVRWIVVAAVVVVVVVVVVGVVLAVTLPGSSAGPAPTLVRAQVGTLRTTVGATGTIAPAQRADLDFGVSGQVTSVSVTVGQQVAAGATLATVDSAGLPGQVAQANASVASAQAKVDADSGASAAQRNADAAALSAAQAQLAVARRNLSQATLTAPFAGTVAAVNVTAGQQVSGEAVGVDARAPEVGALQSRAPQPGTGQVGAVQVGLAQVGLDEIGLAQPQPRQVGAAQVGAAQRDERQVAVDEADRAHPGVEQGAAEQRAAPEARTEQRHALERAGTQRTAAVLGVAHVGTAEVALVEGADVRTQSAQIRSGERAPHESSAGPCGPSGDDLGEVFVLELVVGGVDRPWTHSRTVPYRSDRPTSRWRAHPPIDSTFDRRALSSPRVHLIRRPQCPFAGVSEAVSERTIGPPAAWDVAGDRLDEECGHER